MTEEEWGLWKADRTTKLVMKYLRDRIEQAKDDWLNGQYLAGSAEEIAIQNSYALGKAQGLAELLALDYETYQGFTHQQ